MSSTLTETKTEPTTAPGLCRPLQREDVEELATLFNRVFLECTEPPSAAFCAYFERVFFTDPWRSLNVSPSWVYKTADGVIGGFFGAHPRRLLFEGRPITAVAVGQYMVDPGLRGQGIARQLAQKMVDGPQIITFTTSATEVSSKIFRSVGFWHPRFEGMKWYRRFRRSRIAGLLDRLRRSVRGSSSNTIEYGDVTCRPIGDAAELHDLRKKHRTHFSLCSDFDLEHARWTWNMLEDATAGRRLAGCVMSSGGDGASAWVVYHVSPGGTARIHEFACPPGRAREFMPAFCRYAADCGVREIIGHCSDPEITATALEQGAEVKDVFSGWAVHCKDPAVQSAILNGEVFWSQLDGESWLSFRGR